MSEHRKKKSSGKSAADETPETLSRKIWLAGLGAYGKGLREAQGQLDKASHEAQRAFEELVNKGQRLEDLTRDHLADARERLSADAVREKLNEARDRFSHRLNEVAGSKPRSVDEMIGRVRQKMGMDEGVSQRLERLSQEVAELARAVASIAAGRVPPSSAGDTQAGRRPKSPAKPTAAGAAGRRPKATPRADSKAKVQANKAKAKTKAKRTGEAPEKGAAATRAKRPASAKRRVVRAGSDNR